MEDIFLSYAAEDKDRARLYSHALELAGWTVFWDHRILPGRSWDEVLEEKLNACQCVVVLWSAVSVKSKWVKAEATVGDERGILVPVSLDAAQPPLAFRHRQSAQLQQWQGDHEDEAFVHLLSGIAEHAPARKSPSVKVPRPPSHVAAHQHPPDLGHGDADYDLITVEARVKKNGEPTLEYALDTRRAPRQVRGACTQSRLVKELVATASNNQTRDQRIGRTLFSLLIPGVLEPYMAGTGALQMALDPETAAIPWELLDVNRGQNSDERPWAIRVKLLRKLRLETFRDHVVDATADASALLIGEPACPPEYPRLEGARNEAIAVNTCLIGPGALDPSKVRLLIGADPSTPGPDAEQVINALFERSWRIVHIAGHGSPGANGKPGGVVLSNGTFLGPDEIRSMRVVPELVFVKCCYLGRGDEKQC